MPLRPISNANYDIDILKYVYNELAPKYNLDAEAQYSFAEMVFRACLVKRPVDFNTVDKIVEAIMAIDEDALVEEIEILDI